jgi:Zn-dependent M28 family amino/carboxypeptidase
MNKILLPAITAMAIASGAACAGTATVKTDVVSQAENTINTSSLLGTITTLASDEFEGRSPGTKGEATTIAYIAAQFATLGLAPGNPDGTYFQKVPLVSTLSAPQLSYSIAGKNTTLKFPDDFVAWSPRAQTSLKLNSDMVFVGYGVIAPEYHWDDYKGMDMKGKTLVMLINDPPVVDPKDPSKLDPNMFGGKAMTYYGRWTYKYEIAAKLGAAAAIIIHETKPASYPYEVIRNSWSRENFTVKTDGDPSNYPAVPSWMQLDRAKEMLRASGHDYEQLKQAALSPNFKPISLGTTANFALESKRQEIASNNVVGKIEGSDPVLKNEYIVISAHWDHFGIDTSLPGPRTNQIFHGARDNASGVGALLELAKAFKSLPVAPKRTIVFVATTAEERGLLGAQYYATHPLYPLKRTLVNINIDGINTWGRTSDVSITGSGKSSTDDLVRKYAKAHGRTAVDDARQEAGSFYRADQFELAKVGVPGVYLGGGTQFIGKPAGYGMQKADEYTGHDYHKVSDIVRADWDLNGAVDDIRILFDIGYDIAQGNSYPQWRANAEFKAARDAMMKAAN